MLITSRALMTLLLPTPGRGLVLANGDRVADERNYDVDSVSVLASSTWAAIFERKYRSTFILPLDHFDFSGIGNETPGSVMVNGHDLIKTLDENLHGKVRVDFMRPLKGKRVKPVAQLTFTRPKMAVFFKLMLA